MTVDLDIKPIEDSPDWDGDGIADHRKTLSPSALSSYEICGRRGQFYQDKDIPRVQTLGTARGRAWHTAMENYNVSPEWEGDPHLEALLLSSAVNELNGIVASDEYVAQPGEDVDAVIIELSVMCSAFANADPSVRWAERGIKRIAVEGGVLGDFGSTTHVMPGVVDAVMDVNGDHIGVDYKSAGRAWGGSKLDGDPRKLIQPPLYAEAWSQMHGVEMNWFCMDVMTVKGRFDRVWVRTDKTARQPFVDRWLSIAEQVEMYSSLDLEMPTNPGHILCSAKWCAYWDRCPMGAEYDKVLVPITGTRVPTGGNS